MPVFNPLDHPICLSVPPRFIGFNWTTHIPFGMLLIDLIRPGVFVELGVFRGESYSAFCEAVRALGVETRRYGVDTWQGDIHIGSYGPEIFEQLRACHDPL